MKMKNIIFNILLVTGVMIPTTSFAQSENNGDNDSKKSEISVASTRALTALKGDVNGDGEVNQKDVDMTINYMLKKNPSGFDISAADFNGDGTVSVSELISIITLTPHESTIGGSIGDNN